MSDTGFSAKERSRFRKLLEVANSTTYGGERDAAIGAATRLAESHGMSLREAAGMTEAPAREPEPGPRERPRRPAGFAADFGAAGPENMGRWWRQPHQKGPSSYGYRSDAEQLADEKKRRDDALADAIHRGLDAEERKAAERAAKRAGQLRVRAGKRGAWRARPEFVRVLLTETTMTAKEIAAAAGVTIYDVFREKLLLRRAVSSPTSGA
jgi:hypothetical protein